MCAGKKQSPIDIIDTKASSIHMSWQYSFVFFGYNVRKGRPVLHNTGRGGECKSALLFNNQLHALLTIKIMNNDIHPCLFVCVCACVREKRKPNHYFSFCECPNVSYWHYKNHDQWACTSASVHDTDFHQASPSQPHLHIERPSERVWNTLFLVTSSVVLRQSFVYSLNSIHSYVRRRLEDLRQRFQVRHLCP